jgi:pyruvate/2-oxoacid:ferredoxin oxidoreductase beta subunit
MFERGLCCLYLLTTSLTNTGVSVQVQRPWAHPRYDSPGVQSWGKHRQKNAPAIALARHPPVATASLPVQRPDPQVRQALAIHGPKYIEVRSPYPIGWG